TAYDRLEVESGGPDAIVLALANGVSENIPKLPQVERAWKAESAIGQLQGPAVIYVGVTAGESPPPPGLFTPIIVSGRDGNPEADDEIEVTEQIADLGHLHVGDVLPLKFLTESQIAQFDTGFGEPGGPAIRAKVVGIMRAAVGSGDNGSETFSTPAFARRVA